MNFESLVEHSYLIPLLPLIGAAVAGFLCTGSRKKLAHFPIWAGVGAAAVMALLMLKATLGGEHGEGHEFKSLTQNYFNWISAGDFNVNWGYFFDPLTIVMLCVVCGIGFLITVFAAGYMKGESGYFRFFAYLGLFIFAMTNLVMGENLIMLYLGWEGVGLCSYLLIGYYYDKPSAREAAKKAFLVNRIGDFGFALGIMLCFAAFGTVSYFGTGPGTVTGLLELAARNPAELTPFQQLAMQWIPFLLMLGAFGKSAQFPLYVWLPDAMEGPTPVSALIHAATMVTAGVYMIARCGTLFVGNAPAMILIAVVGAFTALFAGSIALRQFDLKKVFAYSTISQLGFMFVGVATLAPVAGVFHLVTHAFFKALLFLSSGVVMHAMMGELDMRKFSGLRKVLPQTRILMLAGCLALAGFPFFSGFFSKDEIVASAWEHSKVLGITMLLTAFVTAYYTFRLYFRVFEGPQILPEPPKDAHGHGHDSHGHDAHGHDDHHHNHEPMIMMLPLWILFIGAVTAGYLNYPKEHLAEYLGQSPSLQKAHVVANRTYGGEVAAAPMGQMHEFEKWEQEHKADAEELHHLHLNLMIISGLISITGIALAYQVHLKDRNRAEKLAAGAPQLVRLLEGKYWVDEIYQNGIVEPLRDLGRAFFWFDRVIIDGLVWGLSFIPLAGGFGMKVTTQQGRLQGYAVTMLFGIAVILLVIFA